MLTQDKLTPLGRKFCSMIEFDKQEQLMLEIRRHWFGLFLIQLLGGLIILGVFGTMVLWLSSADLGSIFGEGTGINYEDMRQIGILMGFIITVGAIIATGVGIFLYTSNVVLVTSEKIAQLLYISIFNRKISQLHISDIQDVTVQQKGILAHLLNYGSLVIETAGEQDNYLFTFTPKPYESAKLIIESRENNAQLHGN